MENTLQNNINHTKQCGGKEERSGVEQMRRVRWKCGDGEDEWLVEKGYMTTPMAWIRILENKARGEKP